MWSASESSSAKSDSGSVRSTRAGDAAAPGTDGALVGVTVRVSHGKANGAASDGPVHRRAGAALRLGLGRAGVDGGAGARGAMASGCSVPRRRSQNTRSSCSCTLLLVVPPLEIHTLDCVPRRGAVLQRGVVPHRLRRLAACWQLGQVRGPRRRPAPHWRTEAGRLHEFAGRRPRGPGAHLARAAGTFRSAARACAQAGAVRQHAMHARGRGWRESRSVGYVPRRARAPGSRPLLGYREGPAAAAPRASREAGGGLYV